ncbi:MAG: ATP-binding protein [Thermoplasmata archaeon]|nr:MAG: ATP-binding protein [Thermoplasmata archaeon]
MDGRIERVIRDYWQSELPEVKEREINPFINEQTITDIVGPRRAGKTYLMFSLIKRLPKKSTIYINFENRRLLPLKDEYFNDIVEFIFAEQILAKKKKVYLFLDEVQRIAGWERYVRSIYDEFKGKIKIFVSGSSANLLSKDYARLLTGRHLTCVVLPLSFREFMVFRDMKINDKIPTEKEESLIKKYLKEYMTHGGFPEVALGKQKDTMLSQLFSDIVSRDILSRAEIRNENVMEELSNYCASNVSNLLSFGKMTRYFKSRGIKTSTPTLISYFQHMKNAFLFFDNTIFSYKIKDRMQYPRKIYAIDCGFANLAGTENLGRLCENAVAIELLRRGADTFYWKSRSQEEVDFIVREKRRIRPIQVCYDPEARDTRDREVKALVRCLDEFGLKKAEVITFDYEDVEKINNKTIHFTPLWKLLLGISS